MPQFDPTYFASQVFWLLVCFAFLVLYMGISAIPRIRKGMTERENFVDDLIARKTSHLKRIKEILEDVQDIKRDQHLKAKDFMGQLQLKLTQEKELQLKHLQQKFIIDRDQLAHDIAKEMQEFEAKMPQLTKELIEQFEEKILSQPREKSSRHAIN